MSSDFQLASSDGILDVSQHPAAATVWFQTGFRLCYSTETGVLKVLSDILQAVDRNDMAVLVLLALSAAFDTMVHDILPQRLSVTYGFRDAAHEWLQS